MRAGWGPSWAPRSRGQAPKGRGSRRRGAAASKWDSNPAPGCFAVRGRSGGPPVTCDSDLPTVTARARQEPAVSDAVRTQRGPGLRAWKARPDSPLSRDPTPMAQVRSCATDRPLLTVSDRQMPMLRARGGHARARTTLAPAGRQRSPAEPEGEASPRRPPTSLASRRRRRGGTLSGRAAPPVRDRYGPLSGSCLRR